MEEAKRVISTASIITGITKQGKKVEKDIKKETRVDLAKVKVRRWVIILLFFTKCKLYYLMSVNV